MGIKQKRVGIALTVLTVLLSLVLAAIVAGCSTAKSPGKIELSADEFDFGAIPNTRPVSQGS